MKLAQECRLAQVHEVGIVCRKDSVGKASTDSGGVAPKYQPVGTGL